MVLFGEESERAWKTNEDSQIVVCLPWALRAWVWSLLVNFPTVELVSDEKTVPPLTLLVLTGLKQYFCIKTVKSRE
jgi:hypothetical protein